MGRIWKIQERKHQDLGRHLLATRGINDESQIENFLKAEYTQLHSPFLFTQMKKACDRIWQAIKNKEKILIYSDYDADAITANAVVYRMLQAFGVKAEVYIPDRFSEGYGLNLEAFQKIKEIGVSVVITVDCGTNSVVEAGFCKENGIDLIITDHHEITGNIPDAFALINPKTPGEKYPYREVTGVGVAFKLACGLISYTQNHSLPEGYEKWLLDLVAIGTIADCHSLMGENRILVKYGLKVLSKTRWVGLRESMILAGLAGKELNTYSIGFIIAPRINAAGRIDHASAAFDLLVTDDPNEAKRLARALEEMNKKRQMLTDNVMSEARSQLLLLSDRKVLMAYGSDWPKGVVGLVAGKLTEEFGKPVLVLEKGEIEATGSARSIPTFNIVEALTHSKDILVKYGGHAAAAGFTLRSEHIEVFYKNLLDFAENNISDKEVEQVINVDAEVNADEINMPLAEMIAQFEPFGVDNYKPRFVLKNVSLDAVNLVGKEQNHVQMNLSTPGLRGRKIFKAIAFNFAKVISQYQLSDRIDLLFEILCEEWNGSRNLKLRVMDIRKAE